MTMTLIPLNEVVHTVRRTVAPDQIDPTGDMILLENIAKETGEVSPKLAAESETKSSKAGFDSGDILYGKLRPGLRKCCVAERAGVASMDIAILRTVRADSAYYLAAVLRSESFTARVQRLVAGASLPRVSVKELLALDVPWPDDLATLERLNKTAREAVTLRIEIAALLDDVTQLERAVTSGA